jgi:hypothetical protein
MRECVCERERERETRNRLLALNESARPEKSFQIIIKKIVFYVYIKKKNMTVCKV